MNKYGYTVQYMNARNREEALTLEILETINNQSNVTQRHLANRLGVALGLANSYLKRCVRKGLIKIEQAPANRYLYYLTPRGFKEKSRLTAEYLSLSFNFYRRASISCAQVFDECHRRNYRNILLCGISELAEIATLRAREQDIRIVGILEPDAQTKEYIGLPVWESVENAGDFDACVITTIKAPNDLMTYVGKSIAQDRILMPDILGSKGWAQDSVAPLNGINTI
jgi:DNA-binding MarR family transcriptional regulator